MPLIPQVPRRGEVLQGPQSRVGPGTIATPYRVLADALDRAGQTLTDWAVEEAGIEGQNAVTRDADGNLQMRRMSNLTQVGRAYNRAAQQAYLARLSGDIRNSAQQFALDANGNVDAFQNAWAGFAERTLGQVADDLRGPVQTMLDEVGGQQFRGISADRYESDMGEYRDTLVAERARLFDQLTTLAFQGGINTPDGQAMIAQYRDLGTELSGNPAFGIAEEAQQWADDKAMADLVIEDVRGHVARIFATSPAEAREYAETIINDPELPLSAEERRQAVNAVMQQFTASGSAYKVAIDAYRDGTDDLLTRLKDTQLPYSPGEVEEAIQQGLDVGDFTRVAELQRWARMRGSYAGFTNLPQDQAAEVYQAQVAVSDGTMQAFYGARSGSGVTFEGTDPLFGWALMQALAAAEVATGETAQVNDLFRPAERQAQYRANYTQEPVVWEGVTYQPQGQGGLAAPPGQSRHQSGAAADIQSGAILDWLHEHAGEFGLSFLSGDAFTADPGHIQLADGAPSAAPQITADLLSEERTFLSDELRLMLDRAEAVVINNTGLDGQGAAILVDYARAVDDPGLTQRVADVVTESMANTMVNGMSAAEGEALIAELRSEGAGDQYLTTVIEGATERNLAHQAELLRDNPYLYGVEQHLYRAVPLDVADNDALAAGLPVRQQNLAMVSQLQGGTYGLLQPEEAAALAQRYAAAPAEEKVEILATVAGAIRDADALNATMAQLADGDGRVLAMAGSLYQQNPESAAGIIRGQALLATNPERAPTDANWQRAVEDALPLTSFALGSMAQWNMLSEAMLYRYVDLRSRTSGDQKDVAGTELDRALQEVTGGLVTFHGQELIAPVYGMSQREFDDLMGERPAWIMEGRAATLDGTSFTWEDFDVGFMGERVHLRNYGDGRYLIQLGPDSNPLYVADRTTGGTFVLELGLAASASDYERRYFSPPPPNRAPAQPQSPPQDGGAAPMAEPTSETRRFMMDLGQVGITLPEFDDLTREQVDTMADLTGRPLVDVMRLLQDYYGRDDIGRRLYFPGN